MSLSWNGDHFIYLAMAYDLSTLLEMNCNLLATSPHDLPCSQEKKGSNI